LFFRERRFGLSPGVCVGVQGVTDDIYNRWDSRMSVEDRRYGAGLVKMRLGGRRVFATLEYAFTVGGMEVESSANVWAGSNNVFFEYVTHGHSNLVLSVVLRL